MGTIVKLNTCLLYTSIRLIPGDQVDIELDAQDIEKLYEPLVSLANIY